jgi:serine/threonine protein kinase
MAPEQARGEAIDFRADIYALGATLYHLVAGKPPFAGNTVAELLQQHSIADRPALVRADVASRALLPLQGLCARMMAPDAAARPASYDDLLRELELISTTRNRPAGATVRTAAMAIDTFVLLPLLWAVTWALSKGLQREFDGMIAFSLAMPLYRLALLAWRGRTLGQAIFELEVIDLGTASKPSRRQAARRMVYQFGLLVTASLLSSLTGARAGWLGTVGEALVPTVTVLMLMTLYLSSWRHAKRRTWWDRRSDTMVRYRPR